MVFAAFFCRRRWVPVALVLVGVCVAGARETQQSLFDLAEDVTANGGGWGRSPEFIVQDVIGETFAPGTSSTVEFTESEGFIEALTGSLSDPLDINSDGAVNAGDFFAFASGWLRSPGEPGYLSRADFDGNLHIDRHDLDRYLHTIKERS